MYPDTTSLYSATVLDSTSYHQEYDDIIVVQFDEDEPDGVMRLIPKCHIPSCFCYTHAPDYVNINDDNVNIIVIILQSLILGIQQTTFSIIFLISSQNNRTNPYQFNLYQRTIIKMW